MCQLVAYNVANLKSKLNYNNFFTYINNFDIFFLFETHVIKDKRIHFSHYFKDYSLYWEDAKKVHSAGRASGGCLYGFKKTIQATFSLKFQNISDNIILSAKFGDVGFQFIPRYINCSSWLSDFNTFEAFLIGSKLTSFCIIGDLNARVGESQLLDEQLLLDTPHVSHIRKSKDKIVDGKGKKLIELVENLGGVFVNGRTAGDSVGEYTFCGVMGNSVIDFCICSFDFLQLINNFSIPSKVYSDHMPVTLSLSSLSNQNTKLCGLPQKIKWLPSNSVKYSDSLKTLANCDYMQSNLSINEKVCTLLNKIYSSVGKTTSTKYFQPKNKWYDSQCENSRVCMLKKLNLYRKFSLSHFKNLYFESRTSYRKLCNLKKLMYQNQNIEKLNSVKNVSDWWKLANVIKNRSPQMGNSLNVNEFYNHFKKLLSQSECDRLIAWAVPNTIDPFLDSPFEFREIVLVLNNAKLNKAPGQDRISYEFYKFSPSCFLYEVLSLLNRIFLHEDIPSSFRSSIIIPLYKKGDVNNVTNYRGLSLLDTLYKVFTGIILNRINSWIECNDILNEYQAGFRKGYSTVDNIFNLTSIVSLNFAKKQKTFAFFVDFSCAFDLIPRNSLFYKLSNMGMSTKMIKMLQLLYDHTSSQVWDGSLLSDPFSVNQGVKQGCLLSPVLFALYLNDLHDALPCGIIIADRVIKVLLYADDLVLLADSASQLQSMIDALHDYCHKWCLNINLTKSKVVVFRSGTRISSNLAWFYGNEQIEIVNEYKYLGINLTYNLSYKKHLDAKLVSAKTAINASWLSYMHNPQIKLSNKMKIFDSAAKSIMFYGSQVWGYERYEQVEKLFRFFIKKILYLPKNTPNYMLHLETRLTTQFIQTLKLHFGYIAKVFNYPRSRLPRLLAEESVLQNTFWVRKWRTLCIQHEFNFNFDFESATLRTQQDNFLRVLSQKEHEKHLESARNSQLHDIYPCLRYDVLPYVTDKNSPHLISLILRARGGLLNINSIFYNSSTRTCSLCNLGEAENTVHLIGRCPIFRFERFLRFGKNILTELEVIEILNGTNYFYLYKYLTNCLKYRSLIINEFS